MKLPIGSFLKASVRLCRPGVSALAACSAAAGYIVFASAAPAEVLMPVLGVLALACGSSALNQVQERDRDALMERTAGRPLPAGVLSPQHALFVSLVLISAGVAILALSGPMAALLGLGALFWYNGLYTWLKKRTAFAAAAGALVGAIPPAIGWSAAGGSLLDRRLFALGAFLYLWQVPHFWLLVLRYGREYEQAGLPSLSRVFSRDRLSQITLVWIIATAAAAVSLPLYGVVRSPAGALLLVSASFVMSAAGMMLLRRQAGPPGDRTLFRMINLFLLFVMITLSLDSVLTSGWR